MDIESNPKVRNKSKSKTLTTAILIILMLSGTAMTAALQTGSVYGQEPTTLRVVKQVICELPTVCPIQPSNFRITVTGNNPDPASFDGSAQGTFVALDPGDYDVTEATPPPAPPGLTLVTARSSDCTGTINDGDFRTCTMTNAYLSPNGDTDGDGLRNTWEINGIDQNNDGRIDFVIPDANPLYKNLYVEIDYLRFHQPVNLGNVVDAFANAPVTNPNGNTGIDFFIFTNEEIGHDRFTPTNIDTVVNNIRPLWFGTVC